MIDPRPYQAALEQAQAQRARDQASLANARQPWYPLEERYGLIFAYMGPADRQPPLPRYEALEDLGEGESIGPLTDSIQIQVICDAVTLPRAPLSKRMSAVP